MNLYKEPDTSSSVIYTSSTKYDKVIPDYPLTVLEKVSVAGEDFYKVCSDMPLKEDRSSRDINATYDPARDYVYVKASDVSLVFVGTEAKATNPISRIHGDNRYATAYKSADELKKVLGVDKFDSIIVASGENFADALAGSYLSAKKNAPIIMTGQYDYLMNDTIRYIKNSLKEKGTLYILGGPAAIPVSFEEGLSNYEVKRLAGENRYETNLAIVKEAKVTDEEILVCTGNNFADSLSASATGLPILLLNNGINDKQKEFLENLNGNRMTIVGGIKAVLESVEEELKTYGEVSRIAGSTRYETSVKVAEKYFKNPTCAILAYANNFPDGLSGGPLAYAKKAPLILTDSESYNYGIAHNYVKTNNISKGYVLGGNKLISDSAVNIIFNVNKD